jgi:hypothetical protein
MFRFWQSSKKIERTIKDNQPNWFFNLEILLFWLVYRLKKNTLFFFQLKNKNPRKSNQYFFFQLKIKTYFWQRKIMKKYVLIEE